jgi:hypothetical protein
MPERTIPINVPAGWQPARWADYCRHMAESCREVQPELSKEWALAGRFAQALAQQKAPAQPSRCDSF